MAEMLSASFAAISLQPSASSLTFFTTPYLRTKKALPCLRVRPLRVACALVDTEALPPTPALNAVDNVEQFVKAALPGGIAAQRLLATGRRKRAVARVALVEGNGKIIINGRTAQDYLQGNPLWLHSVKFPLVSLGYEHKYDTIVKAHGGGLSAQAQAILLGISRALVVSNQANRDPLKKQGLLTRDPRKVERKKYGLKKARKAPQYSKR